MMDEQGKAKLIADGMPPEWIERLEEAQKIMVELMQWFHDRFPPQEVAPNTAIAAVIAVGGLFRSFMHGMKHSEVMLGLQGQGRADHNRPILEQAADVLGESLAKFMAERDKKKNPMVNQYREGKA